MIDAERKYNVTDALFCRTYDDTMKMFQTMVLELSKRNCLYENTKGGRAHLYDKFDACTAESTKATIIEDLTKLFMLCSQP